MDEPIVPYDWTSEPPDQWKKDARCRHMNPDIFFGPEKGGPFDVRPALDVCALCPVREECLEYALERRDPGVWGGTTKRQRDRIRRYRRTQRRAA